jgi:hypothetical protein
MLPEVLLQGRIMSHLSVHDAWVPSPPLLPANDVTAPRMEVWQTCLCVPNKLVRGWPLRRCVRVSGEEGMRPLDHMHILARVGNSELQGFGKPEGFPRGLGCYAPGKARSGP